MSQIIQESHAQCLQGFERRSEQRSRGYGTMRLTFEDGTNRGFSGLLLDVSSRGFRVGHNRHDLRSGTTLLTELARGTVRAQVMWNRIEEGHIESGLRWL